jgi:membrane protein required for colicin V production
LLGFVAVFLAVMAGGSLLARFMRGGLKRARMDWVDHILGAAFGLARGWLICSVIYLALTAFPVKIEAVERATFAPALLEGTRVIAYLTSTELRERFLSGYTMVQQLWGARKN